jgi:hypothetical protein
MLLARVPLRYGLIAEIVAGEDDRLPYVAPPGVDSPPAPHHPGCPCVTCHPPPRKTP